MTCSKNDYEIIKILDNGKYKIRYLCCGYETEITERTIQAGPKCRRCNQKTRKTHEQFLKEVKELTTAGHNAIRSSVKRVLRGDRKSYLGYRFEEF